MAKKAAVKKTSKAGTSKGGTSPRKSSARKARNMSQDEKIVDKPGLRPASEEREAATPLERAVKGPDGEIAKKAIDEGRDPNRPENWPDEEKARQEERDHRDANMAASERTTQTTETESVTKTAEQVALEGAPGQPAAPQQAVAKPADAPREPNQDAPAPRWHQPGRLHNVDAEHRPAVNSEDQTE